MIITITLIVASLVALNFLLLVISCNKIIKKEVAEVESVKDPILVTSQSDAHQLAPTGS